MEWKHFVDYNVDTSEVADHLLRFVFSQLVCLLLVEIF